MPTNIDVEIVQFTSKGQVVIPSWIRKRFEIERGSRAVVVATEDGILLRPITGTQIRRARGMLKLKDPSGGTSVEHRTASEGTSHGG